MVQIVQPSTSTLSSRSVSSSLFKIQQGASIDDILELNKQWARTTPLEIFETNAQGQSPQAFWIGCSDSRVSESALDNVYPGEIFTLRNVANMINTPFDYSSSSVITYAVNHLKVQKILVVGHTDCGGINTALKIGHNHTENYHNHEIEPVLSTWLDPLVSLKEKYQTQIDAWNETSQKITELSKLNVQTQVDHLINMNKDVKQAIQQRNLEIYGLIYDVKSGLLYPVDLL